MLFIIVIPFNDDSILILIIIRENYLKLFGGFDFGEKKYW